MKSNPLVSIIIITYNSAKYVEETVKSAFNQTYGNIEIIVSDDCSKDNTLEICNNLKRIAPPGLRFEIISTETNKGICGNYNNGLRHAKGEWIKYIAGDDILEPDCVQEFVKKTEKSDNKLYVCNRQNFCASGLLDKTKDTEALYRGDARRQERMINRGKIIISGPTLFIHKDTLIKLGGFEEKYPFIEDYPLAMKFLKNGYDIGIVEKALIRYRVYPESVSRADPRFADSIYRAYEDYGMAAALKNRQYLVWWHEFVRKAIRRKTYPKPVLYLMSGLDPVNWKNKLVKN